MTRYQHVQYNHLIPDGFRVIRRQITNPLYKEDARVEVKFQALDKDDNVVGEPRVYWARVADAYVCHPGFSTADRPTDELRARAAALLMAADECDGLNAKETPA